MDRSILKTLSGLALLGFVFTGPRLPACPQSGPIPQHEVTTWLAKSAHPLKTVEAGKSFQDLLPLKSILKDVQIVGLGEGSHGTREFFQLKHRLLEFLVKEMDYRLFVVEVSYASSLAINDYVLHGKSAKELDNIKRPWPMDTQEWNGLIEWMREYNRTVPPTRKVKFFGYDTKPNRRTMELVTDYLKRVAPEKIEFARNSLSPIVDEPEKELDLAVTLPNAGRPQRTETERKQIRDRLEALMNLFATNQAMFVRGTSMHEFNRVVHAVRTVLQYDDVFSRTWVSQTDPLNTGIAVREIYAAQNLERLLKEERPGSRVVLWAHNGHVSRGYVYASVPTMGSFLSKTFRGSYYAMALIFNRGSFQARNLDAEDSQYGAVLEFSLGPAAEGTVEWYLSKSGVKDCYLDVRTSPQEGAIADWLKSPIPMKYLLGGGFSRRWPPGAYTRPIVLRQYYDGVAFINETSRARPNPSGIRGPAR